MILKNILFIFAKERRLCRSFAGIGETCKYLNYDL